MNKEKKTILAISGSTREHSSNASILKMISELYKDQLDVQLYSCIDRLPHFNFDMDKNGPPQEVMQFREQIAKADGVLICTPEYIFSLPGSLKNALEWTVSTTVFTDKPFAFIVASGVGEKAFESLDLIMTTLLQHPIPASSKLLIKGGRSKIDETGTINDATLMAAIRTLVDSLILQIDEISVKN